MSLLAVIFPVWWTSRSTLFPYTTLFRSVDRREVIQRSGDRRCPRNLQEDADLHQHRSGCALLGSGDRARDQRPGRLQQDRKSTRLNSSHVEISYAVFCLKKKKKEKLSTSRSCRFLLSSSRCGGLRDLPSFPTRRSSDLWTGEKSFNDPAIADALETFKKMLTYTNTDRDALSWDQATALVINDQAAFNKIGRAHV